MFVSKESLTRVNGHIDFGKLYKRGVMVLSDQGYIYKEIIKNIPVEESLISVSRYRYTAITIPNGLINLTNERYANDDSTIINVKEHNINSIGVYDLSLLFVPRSRYIYGFRELFSEEPEIPSTHLNDTEDNLYHPDPNIMSTDFKMLKERYDHTVDINDAIHVGTRDKEAYVHEIIGLNTTVSSLIINEDVSAATNTNKLQISNESVYGGKEINELEIYSTEEILRSLDKILHEYANGDNVAIPDGKIKISEWEDFITGEEPKIIINNITWVNTRDKELPILDKTDMVNLPDKKINMSEIDNVAQPDRLAFENIFEEQVNTPRKGLFNIRDTNVNTPNHELNDSRKIEYVVKDTEGVISQDTYMYTIKNSAPVGGSSSAITGTIRNKEIAGDDQSTGISKHSHGMGYVNNQELLEHSSKPLADWKADAFFVEKTKGPIFMNDFITVGKNNHNSHLMESITSERVSSFGVFDTDSVSIVKDDNGILMNVPTFADRPNIKSIVIEVDTTASKHGAGVYSNENVEIHRGASFAISTEEEYGYISKYDKPIFGSDSYEYVSKYYKPIFDNDTYEYSSKSPYAIGGIDTNVYIEKDSKSTMPNETIEYISKKVKDTRMSRTADAVVKSYRPAGYMDSSDLVQKVGRPIDEYVTYDWILVPERIGGFLNTYLTLHGGQKNTLLQDTSANIIPKYRNAGVNDIIMVHPDAYNAFIIKQNFVDKIIEHQATTNTQITAYIDSKHDTVIDRADLAEKKFYDTHIDDPNNFGYIDKIDYTLIKDDRTDELQLPMEDFNYNEFAQKLIEDGQIQAQYIKRYDDETGYPIVVLPIEHPMKYFADLGIHYIDLNVGKLRYVIAKAYNIWQGNIFKYSAISSVSALNDILVKLKEGIYIAFPDKKEQEHIDRAIRLFRWYAEMSILNNSEYMVKLNYKDLGVNYVNKDIGDFSKISNIHNMAVDNSYVLSPVINTDLSFIEISFTRTHKTRLVFDMAVSGGNCSVTINGVTEVYTDEFVNFDKELPVGNNVISIVFHPDTSPLFNIMKLSIQNYEIKSYKVNYIGKIGETNPTVNYLMSMLGVCGDSIENIQRTVANATATATALDKMREYFDLHHQDKLKGKRLTIKH